MNRKSTTFVVTTISFAISFIWMVPVLYAMLVSFKKASGNITDLLFLVSPPYYFDSYHYVLNNQQADVFLWTFNSFLISSIVTLLVIIVCSSAAYAFTFLQFTGKRMLFGLIFIGLILPGEALLIPMYLLMRDLSLLNTYYSLILPYIASPFALAVLRQFYLGIPLELFESAKIDGARAWKIYYSIVLPLSIPIMSTIGIFIFLGVWNDFLWPYISITKQNLMTIPVGLPYFNSQFNKDFSMPIAAAMLATIPVVIVFLIFQRNIIKGIAYTGIKG